MNIKHLVQMELCIFYSINKHDRVHWRTLTISLAPSNYSFRDTSIYSEDITCRWFSSAATSWLLRLFDFTEWELLEVFFDGYVLGKHILLFCFFLHELAWLICSDILSFFCFFLEHYKSNFDFFERRSCWFFRYLLYFFSDFYLFLGLLWCLISLCFHLSSILCSILCIVVNDGCISGSIRSSFSLLWSYFSLFILIIFMVVLILIVVDVLNIFYFVDFDVESHFV
jgi:hypothetical protein